MKIDHYEQEVFRHMVEWLEFVEREGMDALRDSLALGGKQRLALFAADNPALIHNLAVARSNNRAALLGQLPDQRSRHMALILALHRIRLGYAWLHSASSFGADTSVDVHPFDMMMRAADSAERFASGPPSLWPFDDGTDPLEEGILDAGAA